MSNRGAQLKKELRPPAILALLTLVVLMSPAGVLASHDATGSTETARVAARMAALKVPFILNQGQSDDAVAYYAQTHTGTVFVTRSGELVYALRPGRLGKDAQVERDGDATQVGWTLIETMVGGNPRPAAGKASETQVSVFKGDDPAKWKSDIPTFETVRFGEVWPGIEVEVRAHGNNVEKLLTLKPGAATESIRLRIDGQTRLCLATDGSMIVDTGLGEARLSAPVAWQEAQGRRRPVKVAYRLEDDGSYGFAVGDHDASQSLFIDPILQSTYLGGGGSDNIRAMATHTYGDILVAGETGSADFPGVSGGAQPVQSGATDVFVAELSPGLTSVLRATYLGGSGSDGGYALAVTSWGIYVAGDTRSSNFPGTASGGDNSFGGVREAFIARLDHSLSTLLGSTYFGGSDSVGGTEYDVIYGIAAYQSTGSIVAVGKTSSRDLPGTSAGAQPGYQGSASDGFVAKFTNDLTMLLVSTYFGGENVDECRGVALYDPFGASNSPYYCQVYVIGSTISFNMRALGGFRPRKVNASEGYVARLSNSLGVWEQGTYLGGDTGTAILIRYAEGGSVYVAGYGGGVPGTAGGPQPVGGGGFDGFVELLDMSLTSLIRATYVGGSEDDRVLSFAYQQGTDSIYVGGTTLSGDLPGTEGMRAQSHSGSAPVYSDGFVTRFTTDLSGRYGSTYLGGRISESDCVLLRANDSLYLAGTTTSDDIPNTAGGAQSTHPKSDENEGFISRISLDLFGCSAPTMTVQPLSQTVATGTAVTLNVVASSSTAVSYQWYQGGPGYTRSPVGSNSPSYTTPPLQATNTYYVRVRNACGHTDSAPALITMAGQCVSPWIVTQPASQKIASGGWVALSVVAGGTTPLRYQWYYRGTGNLFMPVGTNTNTYTTPVLAFTAQCWVRVSNDCGTAESAVATITIPSPPVITTITGPTARPGDYVTIYLHGHTTDKGLLNVYFGGVRAEIRRVTRNSIRVRVPPTMRPGRVRVYVISEGLESNRVSYRIRS